MSIKFKTDTGFVDGEKMIDALLKAVEEPIRRLAIRVKALEQREFPYKGVWQASNEYQRGMFITYDGSMWHCCADSTRQKPGSGSDWQLAVKGAR